MRRVPRGRYGERALSLTDGFITFPFVLTVSCPRGVTRSTYHVREERNEDSRVAHSLPSLPMIATHVSLNEMNDARSE